MLVLECCIKEYKFLVVFSWYWEAIKGNDKYILGIFEHVVSRWERGRGGEIQQI